jgi:ABC-2 type transport system ATP-binding protein
MLASRKMDSVVLESVTKVFRHRPAMFNWMGRERTGETRALEKLSLKVPAGRILVLLGPNGSGKTTTLKLVSTTFLPDAGRIMVGGFDSSSEAGQVRRQVGFAIAAERSFFPRLSGRENLDFFAAWDEVSRRCRRERVCSVLTSTGLLEVADTLVTKYSSGMYQRLAIARALLKQPRCLLLDEPTRSLDPGSASRFWGLVRELRDQGTTILLTTHSFSEAAAVADLIAVLEKGRLAGLRKMAGDTAEQLRDFYFSSTPKTDGMLELAESIA